MIWCCVQDQSSGTVHSSPWTSRDTERGGYLEHIVTLSTFTKLPRKKKRKNRDVHCFRKAYDLVLRHKLIGVLKSLWCGAVMSPAAATLGVRQGSPTSCLYCSLSTLVCNLIRVIKENYENDCVLKWLHVLILMNGTRLLCTSRERDDQ